MSEFPWYAEYRPGKLGGKPDPLTRRSGDLPKEGDERLTQRFQAFLNPANLEKLRSGDLRICADILDEDLSLEDLFQQGFVADPFPGEALQMLWDGI
jgi:hypothetical protein